MLSLPKGLSIVKDSELPTLLLSDHGWIIGEFDLSSKDWIKVEPWLIKPEDERPVSDSIILEITEGKLPSKEIFHSSFK